MNHRQRARRHARRTYVKPKPIDLDTFWHELMNAVFQDLSTFKPDWRTRLVPPTFTEIARLHDSVVIQYMGDVVDLKPLASRPMRSA